MGWVVGMGEEDISYLYQDFYWELGPAQHHGERGSFFWGGL
ncbi:hypothetical protein DSUL_140075 [Desulfovibrionales bacterium]